jgi:diguanylate cyclase (GGDEF)-like protein
MPNTTAIEAHDVAVALHRELTTTRFRMNNGMDLTISASVGLSTAPADGESIHAVIGAADSRMYEVKNDGRGRVRGA